MDVVRFKEKYVAYHQIVSEEFAEHLFWKCVFPHAVPAVWIVRFLAPQVFAPDYELVHDAGALGAKLSLREMIKDWTRHPENCGALRKWLQVRVSVRRLRAEVTRVCEAWDAGLSEVSAERREESEEIEGESVMVG